MNYCSTTNLQFLFHTPLIMNLLFICSRNKWRSRTAETIFKGNGDHHVKSAGTSSDAQVKVNAKQIEWADIIFVMEKKHKQILTERFSGAREREIIVLDIEDNYQYMDEELIDLLKTSVSPYL